MLSKIFKLIAGLAVVPAMVWALPASAATVGQLQGGAPLYVVRNLTKGGDYAASVSAAACDELEYSIELHNVAADALQSVSVHATLASDSTASHTSTLTATTSAGGSTGATGSVTVQTDASQGITYEAGTTKLYDNNGLLIKTLPDGITDGPLNVGALAGAATEFVNFKAKVSCPNDTPAAPADTDTPVATYICSLQVQPMAGQTRTAQVSTFSTQQTNGAVFNSVTLDWGDGQSVASVTALDGQSHVYAQDGTYTVLATAGFTVGSETKTATCSQNVTITTASTATTTSTTTTAAEALPDTGAGNVIGIVAGAIIAGTVGYRLFLARKLARR